MQILFAYPKKRRIFASEFYEILIHFERLLPWMSQAETPIRETPTHKPKAAFFAGSDCKYEH